MGSIKEATITGVKWTAIEKFSVQIVNFIVSVLLARLLSPSDFGTIGMIGIFMAISQTFIDSGFSNALIRKSDASEADYSTAFYFNIIVGIVCYFILYISAPQIARFFDNPILSSIVKVYAIALFINSLTAAQYAKLNHELNFKLQARISYASSFISGLIGVLLAYCGYGVWALVWQALSNAAVRALLIWMLAQWRPRSSFSKESFRYLFGYGSKLLASGLLHTIYSNLSSLIIGKYYSSSDLGYYSRGQQFASLPSSTVTSILQKVTFPIFSKIQDDDIRLIEVYRKYIKLTSMIIFFLMLWMTSMAKPIVLFLLTDKWIESVIFIQIFCLALMFDHLCQLNLNLLQVKGRSDLFLKLEIVKKSISFLILICAIPLGVKAICLSSVIYTQIAIIINTYYTGKLFGLGYFAQLKDYFKYLSFSFVACIPSFLLSLLTVNPILSLFAGGTVSCCLYYLLLRKDELFIEIRDYCIHYLMRKA